MKLLIVIIIIAKISKSNCKVLKDYLLKIRRIDSGSVELVYNTLIGAIERNRKDSIILMEVDRVFEGITFAERNKKLRAMHNIMK